MNCDQTRIHQTSFVNEVIIKYTGGRPAALCMDLLGNQLNKNSNC